MNLNKLKVSHSFIPQGSPVMVHTGPFANIAHGNSSIIEDRVCNLIIINQLADGQFMIFNLLITNSNYHFTLNKFTEFLVRQCYSSWYYVSPKIC